MTTPRSTRSTVRIAAIQLEPVVGDVAENLHRCRVLGDEAIGAPVAHVAHCGELRCDLPLAPGVGYRDRYEGGECIVDANGELLAWRGR